MSEKSDREKVEEFLTDLGIPFSNLDGDIRIDVPRHLNQGPVTGYTDFYTAFNFDKDDAFTTLEIGE